VCSELDCERFALERLGEWRAAREAAERGCEQLAFALY
jgi:hypothetical protein